jgi:hypothetical protein
VLVSSGDPGVFAMAAAVFEVLEHGPADWADVPVQVLPGITAMLAAAARAGAPLGHDFCAINLSDNLKPWPLIERRLRLAAQADFAMAFYNPLARAARGFARALAVLREVASAAPGPVRPRGLHAGGRIAHRAAGPGHARDGRHAHHGDRGIEPDPAVPARQRPGALYPAQRSASGEGAGA